MNKFTVLAAMLLASAPVLAQTPTSQPSTSQQPTSQPPSASATKAETARSVEARVARRAARMHAQLKITSAQESAWDAFAQVMRDNVTSTDDAYKQRTASLATMSAPDNMRNFAQIEEARAQGVEKLASTFQALYDTMSDDQKKVADTMFRQYGEHHTGHKGKAK